MDPERLASCLRRLIGSGNQNCNQRIGKEWCLIYKKRDKVDCEYYRAITILNAAYKILFSRLSTKVGNFLGRNQAGFVAGRSTTYQIFKMQQILSKYCDCQVPTHHLSTSKSRTTQLIAKSYGKSWTKMAFPGS